MAKQEDMYKKSSGVLDKPHYLPHSVFKTINIATGGSLIFSVNTRLMPGHETRVQQVLSCRGESFKHGGGMQKAVLH